jgi:hypothetical protein
MSYATTLEEVLALRSEVVLLRKALEELVDAKALSGVRSIVAGWNGENRPDGPFEHRHPSTLGATLKTTCGAVYALDEAMQHGRSMLGVATGAGDE